MKFTPQGGHVRVSLALAETHVDIVVADDGKGIDDAFIAHVFEPFRQAEGALTRKHGGLGLGLAITKHLVELHGGTISVASGGAARGSTFTVRLPTSAGPPSGAHAATQSSIARPSVLQGVRVLLVEDDEDARFLLSEVITTSGAIPTSAGSVAEALEAIARERFAVIVSDISMPGESGFDLIRKLRALSEDAGGATPAIALTAYARSEDRASVLAAGFVAHVAKPIEPNDLIAVVARIVAAK